MGRAVKTVGGRLARGLSHFVRALRNRRVAGSLAGLDDRMLADIGITRSDLRDAYSEPLWHDPTDVLAGRASERRNSQRRPMVFRSGDKSKPAMLVYGSAPVCGQDAA